MTAEMGFLDNPGNNSLSLTNMETRVTKKGQIVIPSKVRRQLEIKEGTRISIDVDKKAYSIILTPITRKFIYSLRGKFKGKGLMKELM